MILYRGDKYVTGKKFKVNNESCIFKRRIEDRLIFESIKDRKIINIKEEEFNKESEGPYYIQVNTFESKYLVDNEGKSYNSLDDANAFNYIPNIDEIKEYIGPEGLKFVDSIEVLDGSTEDIKVVKKYSLENGVLKK